MEKKAYTTPASLAVQLGSLNALMSVSGNRTLSNTRYGGNTSSIEGTVSADTKESSDINLWDNEW